MDFSVLNLRPGIVVYFSADSIHDKEESEYITRLQTYSMRHGLKFEVMAPLTPNTTELQFPVFSILEISKGTVMYLFQASKVFIPEKHRWDLSSTSLLM